MNKGVRIWLLVSALFVFSIGPTQAAEDAALLKDMTSVIALLGLPCGKVVKAVKQGDNDHIVSCQDGNRYRVFLNAEGRVVAEKK